VEVDVHAQNLPPVATLFVSPAVARPNQEVTLTAFGSDPDGTVAAYDFDLDGDRTYETPGDPGGTLTTTFNTPGTRVVGVRVTDNAGAEAVSRRTIEVKAGNDPPTVTLSRGLGRNFFASATDPDGFVAEFAWDLNGDGVFGDATGQFVTLPAGLAGRVEVAVRVTDGDGATASDRTVVTLGDFPPDPASIFAFPAQPRVGQVISLSAGFTSLDSSNIQTIEWDTDGDGTYEPATAGITTVTFSTPGVHVVRIRTTDVHGRSAVGRYDVNVSPATGNLAPVATISGASSALVGQAVTVFGGGSDSDGNIVSTAWDLDEDGEFDDGQFPGPATFTTVGVHTVAVRVTDDQGAVATQYRAIDVHSENRPPRPVVGHNRGAGTGSLRLTQNDEVGFFPGAEASDDPIVSFEWDLDDDGEFDDTETTKRFAEVGPARVHLRATDSGGLTGTATLHIDVRAPVANRAP
jgi:hypothetical protein